MGMFSGRSKALSLYKRGMKKAKNRDLAGAVEDYTLVIKMPNVSNDVKAMALFNRALAYSRAPKSDGSTPQHAHERSEPTHHPQEHDASFDQPQINPEVASRRGKWLR